MVVVGVGCLFLLLAGLGIVAAIAIPAYLDAQVNARQKRTIGDLRQVAALLEAHRAQSGSYPSGDVASLQSALAAQGYERALRDQWNQPFRYTCLSSGEDGCVSYELASPGRDGAFENAPGEYEPGTFVRTAWDSDLVVRDGEVVRQPVGPSGGGGP